MGLEVLHIGLGEDGGVCGKVCLEIGLDASSWSRIVIRLEMDLVGIKLLDPQN